MKYNVCFIEEASMISAKLFQIIAAACTPCIINILFSDHQIVFRSECLQLQSLYSLGDAGRHCFQSPLCRQVYPRVVILIEVIC